MRVLLTGAAGFIGYHVASVLLHHGHEVIGVDNLNDYYDVRLKEARLQQLAPSKNFRFHKLDIADRTLLPQLLSFAPSHIVHLAAQAGVRYSLTNPFTYAESNLMGQLVILELARNLPDLQHFVYASSSSVYGGNTKTPFAVEDPVEKPVSLYAATKRADELMSWTYAHLFRIPVTGLRFFTVYGPWGRPDMATYLFTQQILNEKPIKVFNNGEMRRDFTYIDDIVSGVIAVLQRPPPSSSQTPPVKLYNLGNSRPENLMHFIRVIEKNLGKKAQYDFQPLQNGDVLETFADISASTQDFGYHPSTSIEEGIPKFIAWYKKYHGEG